MHSIAPKFTGSLLRRLGETLRPSDREMLLAFAGRADVAERDRTEALMTPERNQGLTETQDWFFDAYQAGVITGEFFDTLTGMFSTGETADQFVRRATESVVADRGHRMAPRLMKVVAEATSTETEVRPATAPRVLEAIDQLEDRPGFEVLADLRSGIARAAGGREERVAHNSTLPGWLGFCSFVSVQSV